MDNKNNIRVEIANRVAKQWFDSYEHPSLSKEQAAEVNFICMVTVEEYMKYVTEPLKKPKNPLKT